MKIWYGLECIFVLNVVWYGFSPNRRKQIQYFSVCPSGVQIYSTEYEQKKHLILNGIIAVWIFPVTFSVSQTDQTLYNGSCIIPIKITTIKWKYDFIHTFTVLILLDCLDDDDSFDYYFFTLASICGCNMWLMNVKRYDIQSTQAI